MRTQLNRMYKTVQIKSEPRIPIGISRSGFLVSWATVETASKPMKAKKTTPAPPRTPQSPPKFRSVCLIVSV